MIIRARSTESFPVSAKPEGQLLDDGCSGCQQIWTMGILYLLKKKKKVPFLLGFCGIADDGRRRSLCFSSTFGEPSGARQPSTSSCRQPHLYIISDKLDLPQELQPLQIEGRAEPLSSTPLYMLPGATSAKKTHMRLVCSRRYWCQNMMIQRARWRGRRSQ